VAIIEPNDEEKQEKLPNDFDTPFSPPSGVKDNADDTHPEADTNVDSMERYDEGISGAMEVDDRRSSIVTGYTPPDQQADDDDAKKTKRPHSRHEEFSDES
jgi:hypothetical protein